jgi:hypothetical protein
MKLLAYSRRCLPHWMNSMLASNKGFMTCWVACWMVSLYASNSASQCNGTSTAFAFQKAKSVRIRLNLRYFCYMLISQFMLFTQENNLFTNENNQSSLPDTVRIKRSRYFECKQRRALLYVLHLVHNTTRLCVHVSGLEGNLQLLFCERHWHPDHLYGFVFQCWWET